LLVHVSRRFSSKSGNARCSFIIDFVVAVITEATPALPIAAGRNEPPLAYLTFSRVSGALRVIVSAIPVTVDRAGCRNTGTVDFTRPTRTNS
jgi:hypothetical protein